MTTETVETNAPVSVLGMSDEAMATFDPSTLVAPSDTTQDSEPADEAPEQKEVADEVAEDTADAKAEIQEDKDVDPENPDEDDVQESDEATTPKKDGGSTKDEVKEAPEATKEEGGEVDFKAAYDKLLTPFKANGKEIAVKNVDDAIALMQMGANYNKKMAALKPNLKLMKLLENNGLLSEEKLSYLIDLDKKDPSAINKLVKDSGIDPLDLNADKASGYKPNTYTVDDREIELDTVLDELQGTPSYNRTLDIVSTKWDGASKQVIAGSPQLLKVINDHVDSGIYDLISKEVESERVFGRLNGLSDIEAYRQVGDAIQARGGFAQLGRQGNKPATEPVVVAPKPKKVDDDKLRDKKRAASSTKPTVPTAQNRDFNPLALSDEEFSKQVNNKFL